MEVPDTIHYGIYISSSSSDGSEKEKVSSSSSSSERNETKLGHAKANDETK